VADHHAAPRTSTQSGQDAPKHGHASAHGLSENEVRQRDRQQAIKPAGLCSTNCPGIPDTSLELVREIVARTK
jgi:hypothetical protein